MKNSKHEGLSVSVLHGVVNWNKYGEVLLIVLSLSCIFLYTDFFTAHVDTTIGQLLNCVAWLLMVWYTCDRIMYGTVWKHKTEHVPEPFSLVNKTVFAIIATVLLIEGYNIWAFLFYFVFFWVILVILLSAATIVVKKIYNIFKKKK